MKCLIPNPYSFYQFSEMHIINYKNWLIFCRYTSAFPHGNQFTFPNLNHSEFTTDVCSIVAGAIDGAQFWPSKYYITFCITAQLFKFKTHIALFSPARYLTPGSRVHIYLVWAEMKDVSFDKKILSQSTFNHLILTRFVFAQTYPLTEYIRTSYEIIKYIFSHQCPYGCKI